MFKKIILISSTLALLFSYEAFAKKDRIIAKYNGKKIYESEIEKLYSNLVLRTTGKKNPEGFKKLKEIEKDRLVRGIIGNKLLEEKVKNSRVKETSEYRTALKEATNQVAKKIFIEQITEKAIDDKKLKDRYAQLKKIIEKREEVKASHILVKTEKEASKIHKDLKKGLSFEKIAKESSLDSSKTKGGDLGYFTKGQMVAEFEKTAFNLKIGQISKPTKTKFGWHVIKLNDKRKMKAPSYKEIKPRLKAEMKNEELKKFLKSLEDSASIKMMLK